MSVQGYYIMNVGTQKYFNLSGGGSADGTNVIGWSHAESAMNTQVYLFS
jgi:hypothetical protein